MSKDDRELIEAPAPITPDDAPHWLKGWTPEFYAKQHNEQIGQMVREVSIAGGAGGTAVDWVRLAKDYLRTIADNSPPQGGLHHSLRIVTEQLSKVATRLEALQAQPVGEEKLTMAIRLTDDEQAAIERLMAEQELSRPQIFRCALREYQMGQERRKAGETVSWSGDGQRLRDFAGPALTASPPVVEREAIARIIEPLAWSGRDQWNGECEFDDKLNRANSLAKADAILALTSVEGVGEREGLTDADIFDMGYAWQQMLTGQTLEDARAIGRTLGCDLFQPIAEHVDAAEKEMGFNPFQASDQGIVQAKAIIKAALARHRAASTPVAQGDEVRS
jgi:hypothetical protein